MKIKNMDAFIWKITKQAHMQAMMLLRLVRHFILLMNKEENGEKL
jgi:hypothetical protein